MSTEFKLSYTASEIDARLGNAGNSVLFAEQTITDEQKAQARTNIGACSTEEVQSLIDTAIANIPDYNGEVEDI